LNFRNIYYLVSEIINARGDRAWGKNELSATIGIILYTTTDG